ncbi:hypothetical protein C2E21_7385 [Chlorella sorokiniana]|uniref:EF-hand domain-containing protein n=1 Tax=Chlorella sorokiniana TaxID=3076 RepID=A0A2P6TIB5_CHLSO|nr:hypothetical protein C2E21_7385 [Chlorella sorokiniana]|eukprot:PRW34038.1 hypothetical protein C2E21_7385 [Chlorella sorokiniana]
MGNCTNLVTSSKLEGPATEAGTDLQPLKPAHRQACLLLTRLGDYLTPLPVHQEAAPDPGMQPKRYTHQRARGPTDLHLSAPAAITGATPGAARTDRPRPRAQPLNPLEPAYPWYPERQEAAPPPKFVRDTLDITDIAGAKASPPAQPPRGLPSTMRADDIEGTRPGWRPHTLFAEQPRDPLHVADICPGPVSKTSRAGGQQQGGGRALDRSASERQAGGGNGVAATAGGVAAVLPLSARPFQPEGPAVPEYGVAYTVDWRKQWAESKLRQAEAARQAQAAADAAIAAAAAKAAGAAKAGGGAGGSAAAQGSGSGGGGGEAVSAVGLAGMMKSLRTFDRDGCGFVQAGELAAALQQSRLGLSQGDVQHLVAAVRSPGGSVEYRPFVSKLWGQLQQQGAVPVAPPTGPGQVAPSGSVMAGGRAGATSSPSPAEAAAAAPVHLPQFVVARQRRLQTNVALALAQQPEATAREAAELAGLPGYLPWKPKPEAQFGKRMAYERPAELGTAPSTTFTFADGDPRAAEAALQWKASKAMPFQTAMRRENRPSKQHQQPQLTGRGGFPVAPQPSFGSAPVTASLPGTPAETQIRAVHAQRAVAQLATPAVAGDQAVPVAPATAAAAAPLSSAAPAPQQWRAASASGQAVQASQLGAGIGQRQVASAGGSRSGGAAPLRAGSAGSPLATERATAAAAREEVALLRSLS